MKKLFIIFIIFYFGIVQASQFSLTLKTNQFSVGERIRLKVSVLNNSGTIDSNYSGYIKLFSDNPLLKIKGGNPDSKSVDIDNQGNILLSHGQNNKLFCYSYGAGHFILQAEDVFQNTNPALPTKTISYSVSEANKKLILNEVMYKTSNDSLYEYVELHNITETDLNSVNVTLYSMTSKTDKTLLASSTVSISAHNYLLLARNINALSSIFPELTESQCVTDNLSHSLNSTCQFLLYINNQVSDTFEYESDWVKGYNYSLERVSPNFPSYKKDTWASSLSPSSTGAGFYGTPGAPNKSTSENKKDLQINLDFKSVVSKNAIFSFEYSANVPGKIRIILLDSQGLIRKTLISEKDIASNTHYFETYNLKNIENLNTGLYFISLQFINETLGLSRKKTKTFVIR